MIEVSQVLNIKQLSAQGMSIRKIAKETGVARNTVKRYLHGRAMPGVYQRAVRRSQPVRDAIRPKVYQLLQAEKEAGAPRKQRLTAARIERILRKKGFAGSSSTVRAVVREVRMQLRDALKHAYLPLAYDPGVDAQVDFCEAEVDDVDQGRVKVHILIVRACYSRRSFLYAAPNQTREALLEGLIRAFDFFGAVFKNLWFDNLTPAVRKVLKGRTRILQRKFESFQAHYGFQAQFCRPGKGNEKGGVEGEVKFVKHEVLSPIPPVKGRAGLQELCDQFVEEERSRTVRGLPAPIGEMWKHEQPHMIALPDAHFDAASIRVAKVTPRSWIQLGTNFYSVPVRLVGYEVKVKLSAEHVVVFDKTTEVARHDRAYGREQMILELSHYLPLLRRKHRGLDRAVPLRQWLNKVPSCWRALLQVLRKEEGEVAGSKSFIEALYLCTLKGVEQTTQALRKALLHPHLSVATLRFYLYEEIEASSTVPSPLSFAGPKVHQDSPQAYMDLCSYTEASNV